MPTSKAAGGASLPRNRTGARHDDLPDVPPERPPSLAEHVRNVIRGDILNGRQEAGSRLTEAMVMERTRVSRTPVREGLRALESEGLVITYRSRGTFVTYRMTPEEALLLYQVRLVLEPHLAGLAAQRITPEALAMTEAVLDRFVEAMDGADPREAGQLDADFHIAVYEASGSELLSVLRGYWARLQLELSERVYTTELPRQFADEHREILDALRTGDSDRARDGMKTHLEHGRAVLMKALAA
jgi:DNA-binding GntR family transcriptional regulator